MREGNREKKEKEEKRKTERSRAESTKNEETKKNQKREEKQDIIIYDTTLTLKVNAMCSQCASVVTEKCAL